ncbi:MAG: NADH-quinone oxidoreductase subunit H [Elusimicrobiota bacterium]|jgi:formate hydrogenlyase subunit 4
MNGIPFFAALLFAPLLSGIINRVKAVFAGRRGPPLLQPYHDMFKLLRKGAVYSRTTGGVFRAGPVVGLAAVLAALMIVPWGGARSAVSFPGDFVMMVCLLGLLRFLTVIAALDTGSSFEGMGASREVTFSALAEPALLLCLAALARQSQALSLSDIFADLPAGVWTNAVAALALVAAALFVVCLAENARIPVDDPNTHLELTMIHEVMVLDHSGPDLAFIFYGSALKLWLFEALLVGVLSSGTGQGNILFWIGGMAGLAVVIGVVESAMARLRLSRIAPLLVGAGVCSLLALLLVMR